MAKGQLIKNANIIISNKGEAMQEIAITTIGRKRIITFSTVEASEISVVITHAKAKPQLQSVEGYLIDESLIEH